MSVYVDELQRWGNWKYGLSCHLLPQDRSPEAVEELHRFAAKIGMDRAWFQGAPQHRWPHYDLTARRRHKALAMGAIDVRSVAWMRRVNAEEQAAAPSAAEAFAIPE